ARERAAWAALGAVQKWRVAGPYAALRFLQLGAALPLDGPTDAAAPRGGPAGPTGERDLDFPDGDVGLEMEPGDGDVFYAASEVSLARGGDYLLWVEGAAALEVRLDGAVAVARAPYPREVPRAQTAAVHLQPGKRALLARWSRAEGGRFRIALVRSDGAVSDAESAAPAEVSGMRA